ncbi:hypothetical protein [Prauserella muralis]|uniref:Uncharacterized protein n=1 Tax=Prauserella muralis TaxID=588067 RepID=A0A2V4B8Q2_9PSEU|nr:hypothetical protein [Prauserella muralis]PXY31637.1 hypothetical protein BAY60_04520 [Prauserella muralis]TWE13998.1 hypothetical protein FHX69_6132 [Prauserella muralis]
MVGNVLIYLGVVVTPTLVAGLVLALPKLGRALARRRPPAPPGAPVERIAADLRRVHRSLTTLAPDAPVVRRRATCEAYDALLAQACRAVGVEQRLGAVAGVDREIERLRLEEELRAAGLVIR